MTVARVADFGQSPYFTIQVGTLHYDQVSDQGGPRRDRRRPACSPPRRWPPTRKPFTATARIVKPADADQDRRPRLRHHHDAPGLTSCERRRRPTGGAVASACGTNLDLHRAGSGRLHRRRAASTRASASRSPCPPTGPDSRNGAELGRFAPTRRPRSRSTAPAIGASNRRHDHRPRHATVDGTYSNDINVTVEYN